MAVCSSVAKTHFTCSWYNQMQFSPKILLKVHCSSAMYMMEPTVPSSQTSNKQPTIKPSTWFLYHQVSWLLGQQSPHSWQKPKQKSKSNMVIYLKAEVHSLEIHTTLNLTLPYLPNEFHYNLFLFINKMHSRNSLQIWNKLEKWSVNEATTWSFITVQSDGKKKNLTICFDPNDLSKQCKGNHFTGEPLMTFMMSYQRQLASLWLTSKKVTGRYSLVMRALI